MNRSSDIAEEQYRKAQDLAASGQYLAAIETYSLTINGDPSNVKAICGRGLAFQRIGNHQNAIADFSRSITSDPMWSGAFIAYYSRAVSRSALGEFVGVVDDCSAAINLNERFTDALYLRGTSRKTLGDF